MGRIVLYSLFQLSIILLVILAVMAILMVVTAYISRWIGPTGVLLLYLFIAGAVFYLFSTTKGKCNHE